MEGYAFGGGGSGAGVREAGESAVGASILRLIDRISPAPVVGEIPMFGPHEASAAQQSLRVGTSHDLLESIESSAWCIAADAVAACPAP